jgi:ribosome recycling factor
MPFNANVVEENMKKAVEHTSKDMAAIRTGRASTSVLDSVKVEYYGSQVPISQAAGVGLSGGRTIEIKPWEASSLQNIEKAILKSDIGLTPVSDGKIIRINIPPLTEERRKELVKQAKKLAEDGKVSLRNVRRQANEEIDKQKGAMSDDDIKKNKDKIQKMLDMNIAQLDRILTEKEKAIMEV